MTASAATHPTGACSPVRFWRPLAHSAKAMLASTPAARATPMSQAPGVKRGQGTNSPRVFRNTAPAKE